MKVYHVSFHQDPAVLNFEKKKINNKTHCNVMASQGYIFFIKIQRTEDKEKLFINLHLHRYYWLKDDKSSDKLWFLFKASLWFKLFSRVVELCVQSEQSCTHQVSLAADLTVKAGLGSRTSDYYSIRSQIPDVIQCWVILWRLKMNIIF